MGERITLGSVIFTVLETHWETHLGEGPSAKTPNHRYLRIRLTVNNAGAQDASVPFFTLEDNKGQSFREIQSGDGIPQWLGYMRRLQPAVPETGNIVFDVPSGAYKLRLTDGAEPENAAYVELPLQIE
jgi:hypothetical protein